ncbi:helix-turn-helix domain-containing protein [Haloarchaeobius litoreus]|uniref:Helix-turn-helix domain-containing protein n=1 Tax=Haloarchaeobius litoreus TaxID=755306 RepID=A0ABD6DQC7_9EURY|nr:helix-turn-helix domain-containing protein [Haloarchaeobius litoreus]
MTTVVEFVIPAHEFPLGAIAENHPSMTVELERIVPTELAIMPYFWVRGIDGVTQEEVMAGLAAQEDVKNVEVVDQAGGAYLMRAEWESQCEGVMRAITTTELVLLSGIGNSEQWTFELRATDHEAIASFQEYCHEHDIHPTLTSMHRLSEMDSTEDYDLTPSQREALVLAYERGYYQTPRSATLAELAEELDITGQSLGSRLRRGTHRLIAGTLIELE